MGTIIINIIKSAYDIIIATCTLSIAIGLAIIINRLPSIADEFIRLKNKKIIFEVDMTTDDILMQFDKLIELCFSDYMFKNHGFKDGLIINSDMEREIIEDVTHLFIDRLSPDLITRYSLYYNIDELNSIVVDKVQMFVTAYVLQAQHTVQAKK